MARVPAASHVLGILRYLARQAGPVPAAAISHGLRLPRSTTYHLLATLCAEGFVVHLPEDRRYGLGVSAYELGSGYTRQAPLQRLARVPLASLVDSTGHTAHLAVLHGREVIYVIEERAPGRPPLVTDVGVRLPATLTASGRAMLAALPAAQVRALFPGREAFVLRGDAGPRSLAALRQRLGAWLDAQNVDPEAQRGVVLAVSEDVAPAPAIHYVRTHPFPHLRFGFAGGRLRPVLPYTGLATSFVVDTSGRRVAELSGWAHGHRGTISILQSLIAKLSGS